MLARFYRWARGLVRKGARRLLGYVVRDYRLHVEGESPRTIRRVVETVRLDAHIEILDIDGTRHLVRLDSIRSLVPLRELHAVTMRPLAVMEE